MVADLKNVGLNDVGGCSDRPRLMWICGRKCGRAPAFTSVATAPSPWAKGSFLVTGQASQRDLHGDGRASGGCGFHIQRQSLRYACRGWHIPITITANNGIVPNATQQFTLVVKPNSMFITSPDTATFQAGTAGSFAIGLDSPRASVDHHLGTTSQRAGLQWEHERDFRNAGIRLWQGLRPRFQVYPRAGFRTAKLALTVNEGPSFLSANKVTPPLTFNTGTAASFQIDPPGYPFPALSIIGKLPPGLVFNPATAVLAGTVQPGHGGVYTSELTARNAFGFAGENLTIIVNDAPVITSVATTTFTIGQDNVFLITATGYPSPKFSWSSSSLPGVTFDNSGKLAGQSLSDNGLGKYTFVVSADTGVAKTTQNFTLYIKDSPKITWSPGSLQFSNPLGAAQLNATAVLKGIGAIPGTFVYSPPVGTILPPGAQLLSVTFTPSDTTKYFGLTAQAQVNVSLVNVLPVSVGNTVSSARNGTLTAAQILTSPSGRFVAVMQADGNFVVYNQGAPVWASNTNGQGSAPFNLIMQSDGNLVVYAVTQTCEADTACIANWFGNSKGKGTPPYMLTMQDDGNLIVYDSTNTAIWTTDTNQFQNIITSESAPLMMGQALTSPNRIYQAVMQTDGNFVVYHGTTALWATGTTGPTYNGSPNGSPYEMVLTPDGDLEHLAYGQTCPPSTPCIANWFSNSKGKGTPPYKLTMQDDGNLVVYDSTNTPTWATGTYGR